MWTPACIKSFLYTKTRLPCILFAICSGCLNAELWSRKPSSDSDSWKFRLSNSDSGPTPTFSCISYLLKEIILVRWIHKPYLHFPGIRKLVLNRCKCTFITHFCKMRSSRSWSFNFTEKSTHLKKTIKIIREGWEIIDFKAETLQTISVSK